jgi:xanthine dehydrogenase accessory factor
MRDVLTRVRQWTAAGVPVAIGTVVGVSKSAPRQPGAVMAVSGEGEVAGSVSGGCVEGAVVQVAQEVLADGTPQLASYGYSDEDAFSVGLTCGGTIEVFVERLGPGSHLDPLAAALEEELPVAMATVLAGPAGAKLLVSDDDAVGTLGNEGLDVAVTADARGLLAQGLTGTRRYGHRGERRLDEVEVFIESFTPPPRMLVFGAIDYAAAVARIGSFLGYRVTVCDARKIFATPQRSPDADEIVVEWPHRYLARTTVDARAAICVLTHDPKFDVPLLEVALETDAAYIGAMGSRRTHEDRLARLRERGVAEDRLARLRSPIGLDLGARTPEETAVSIAAELVQSRWGGSGRPLADTTGAIHAERSPAGVT